MIPAAGWILAIELPYLPATDSSKNSTVGVQGSKNRTDPFEASNKNMSCI
jgi:hypothetical protein